MSALGVWRGIALLASMGWAATVVAWMWSASGPTQPPMEHPTARESRPEHPERRKAPRGKRSRSRKPVVDDRSGDLEGLRDEVREEVWAEVEAERAQRRKRRHERRLDRLLGEVREFGDSYELDDQTTLALEGVMEALHKEMGELRPPGPPGPGGPPAELVEAMESAFQTLEDDVYDILVDEELAEVFIARVKPPPLRGR